MNLIPRSEFWRHLLPEYRQNSRAVSNRLRRWGLLDVLEVLEAIEG